MGSLEQNAPAGRGMGVETVAGILREEIPIANNLTPGAAVMDGSQQQNSGVNHHHEVSVMAAAGNGLKKRVTIPLPLEVGTRVLCRWRDGKLHPVKVIERRKLNSGPDDYQYYVHYNEFNRRLDEWVKLDQLELESVEADADEKVEDKAGGLKMTRHQKRKIEETHAEEGHEDFDAASLREHEEFTKVKNISKIELGRYEIDTWYFSPFPPEYSDCSKLFFCEFCLSFVKRKEQLARHMRKCDLKHPPGDEIYRQGSLSMFEVDGKKKQDLRTEPMLFGKVIPRS